MFTRITLLAAVLIGGAAVAQQNNPTTPSNPAAPHTPPVKNQIECWDIAANRARNPQTGSVSSGSPGVPQNLPSSPEAAAPASSRPLGMTNC